MCHVLHAVERVRRVGIDAVADLVGGACQCEHEGARQKDIGSGLVGCAPLGSPPGEGGQQPAERRCRADGEHHPRLKIQFEDGVHATNVTDQSDEFDGDGDGQCRADEEEYEAFRIRLVGAQDEDRSPKREWKRKESDGRFFDDEEHEEGNDRRDGNFKDDGIRAQTIQTRDGRNSHPFAGLPDQPCRDDKEEQTPLCEVGRERRTGCAPIRHRVIRLSERFQEWQIKQGTEDI